MKTDITFPKEKYFEQQCRYNKVFEAPTGREEEHEKRIERYGEGFVRIRSYSKLLTSGYFR